MLTEIQELLAETCQNSDALVIAQFSANDETLLYANAGMQKLLQNLAPKTKPAEFIVNPSLDKLKEGPETGWVFSGILTVGNGRDFNLSLLARVYHQKQQILIVAEHNVAEIMQINQQVLQLNSQVQRLQRELIKEKSALEKTLAELKKTQAMLIHSEKMNALGQMVAGVAHEINNPLGFAGNNMQLLAENIKDIYAAYLELEALEKKFDLQIENQEQAIREHYDLDYLFADIPDLIHGTLVGIQRAQKIVQNLRNFSRLDEAKEQDVDLKACLEESLVFACTELKNKQINYRLDCQPVPKINGYPAELNQVFLNLIINAVQAMPENGQLVICLSQEDNKQVIIRFQDNGSGISDEIKPHIFEPFFTTKPVGNSGLGLSIAYNIITQMHSGSIQVDSAPGTGTTFIIKLPVT